MLCQREAPEPGCVCGLVPCPGTRSPRWPPVQHTYTTSHPDLLLAFSLRLPCSQCTDCIQNTRLAPCRTGWSSFTPAGRRVPNARRESAGLAARSAAPDKGLGKPPTPSLGASGLGHTNKEQARKIAKQYPHALGVWTHLRYIMLP